MRLLRLRYATSMPLVLLAATMLPTGAAANGSAMARREFAGFRVLPDDMEHDFRKRQDTAPSASPAPTPGPSSSVAAPQPSPAPSVSPAPSEPSSQPSSTNQGSPSVADPPSASPTPNPSSSSVNDPPSSIPPSSTIIDSPAPSSSSSTVNDPSPGPSSSSSSPSGSSVNQPASTGGSSSGGGSAADPTPGGSSSGTDPSSSPPAGSESPTDTATASTSLNSVSPTSTSVGEGSESGSASSTGTRSHSTGVGSPSPSGSESAPTETSTVSYSLSYEYQTVTNGGSESISIGTVSISAGLAPIPGPAQVAAPLVVQQALPNVPNPQCTMDYLPADVWATSGSPNPPSGSGNNVNTGNTGNNGNGTVGGRPPAISQCNNGTKVSNHIGSAIHLKFTGTQFSLLMVPGLMGGDYDVKLDNEDAVTLSNYKPDVSDCLVTTAWARDDLPNKPHDITVIVKGSSAGAAAGGSQVEFNGLIFKGPKSETASGPGLGVIIGAAVGGVVLIAALVAIAVVCIRKRRARRVTSSTGPAALASPQFRPQTVMSGHSGHTRADSNFSAAPSNYNPSHQPWQNAAGVGTAYGPVIGHTRQTSDAPLMGMVQGQRAPWQPASPVMNNANIPPGAASPSVMGSPQSRVVNNMGGYGHGQDRSSYAPSHNRATSYGSDGRNPFE